MLLPVALTTTGAAALINLWLGVRVSRVRISDRVLIGDNGNPRLLARMRAQANFTEYTPFVLMLVALIEFGIGSALWLWAVAALYLLARLAHAIGMDGWRPARMIGILFTWATLLGLGVYAVFLAQQYGNPLR